MVSIILPVYNRSEELEKGLPGLKALLEKQSSGFEVIIVDDGSVMKEEMMSIARHHDCRYIRNEPNAGKGMAVRRGMLAASGNIIIFMDGDFPFHLSVIDEMVNVLQNNKIVIGDRTLPSSSYPKEISLYRKWGSNLLSCLINWFYVRGIRDSQCGIKGFRAETGKAIFNKVSLNGFAFDVEVLVIARKNKYDIMRTPVHVYAQPTTSVRVMKDGLGMLISLIRIAINNVRGKYIIDE